MRGLSKDVVPTGCFDQDMLYLDFASHDEIQHELFSILLSIVWILHTERTESPSFVWLIKAHG